MKKPLPLDAEQAGFHNANLELARGRLIRSATYKDCSTVIVIPAIAPIPVKIVQAWLNMMHPMNQRIFRIVIENAEVGDAYNQAVQLVLSHPDLSKWKYLLTLETDNAPPPDGLLKLIEDIESPIPGAPSQKWAAVGGLYWTKGEGGMPMCYGKPGEMPRNCIPWLPPPNSVAECNGLGMGFTLFRIDAFKKMAPPYFRTVQEYDPQKGSKVYTQDLSFCEEAAKFGCRFACSTRVLVGHWDEATKKMW